MDGRQWRATIAAAQAGDRHALDELVAGWLPLVYNIVGRALNGHADVDDVVQETMLRAVDNLGSLRDPDSFRSWLVAIAMRQIRDRARRRTTEPPLDDSRRRPTAPPTSPNSTVAAAPVGGPAARGRGGGPLARRRGPATAVAVVAGGRRRTHPARTRRRRRHQPAARRRPRPADEGAPGDRAGHRPRPRRPPAPTWATLTARWNGRPDSVWRKRLARHIRGCALLRRRPASSVVPAERLLVGHRPGARPRRLHPVPGPRRQDRVAATATLRRLVRQGARRPDQAGRRGHGGRDVRRGRRVRRRRSPRGPAPQAAPARSARPARRRPAPPPRRPPPRRRPHRPPPPPRPRPGRPTCTAPSSTPSTRRPDPDTRPAALPHRPESGLTSSGGRADRDEPPRRQRDPHGQGYVLVRWQISPAVPAGRPGHAVLDRPEGQALPCGLGRRPTHGRPDRSADGTATGMGGPATGYTVLPAGTQQMWQNEYFYVDGTVTLTQNERGADYGITVFPSTWDSGRRRRHATAPTRAPSATASSATPARTRHPCRSTSPGRTRTTRRPWRSGRRCRGSAVGSRELRGCAVRRLRV